MDELANQATLDPNAPLSEDVEAATSTSGRMRALYEIGKQLLEQRDIGQVLRTFQRAVIEHLGPDHACVLAVDPDGSYRPLAVHALDLDRPEDHWSISRTALEKARESGLALLATDVLRDPKFEKSGSVQKLGIRSVICVPLGKNPVRALIYVDRRDRHQPFDRRDLQFLTAAAGYASLVLDRLEEHARASREMETRVDALELLQSELLRHRIIGQAPALLRAYDDVRRFASAGARVLLRGETGTGKELFARAYAANAKREGKPYLPVSIPALAPNLVESELFGHVKGAFTEASQDKKGYFEVAEGGVLFLDEIGDIEPALQVKLLRFLDSGEIYRVGDTTPKHIDVLIVSATNRPIEKLVEQGKFRADLLARLGHPIEIPPLRERGDDVSLLVDHFSEQFGRSGTRKRFTGDTLDVLKHYAWEFNVRQLQQVVESVICLVDHDVIGPDDLPDFLSAGTRQRTQSRDAHVTSGGRPAPLKQVVEEAEQKHILETLEFTKGNRRKAIELLGVSSETFYKRLEDMGLHKKGERS